MYLTVVFFYFGSPSYQQAACQNRVQLGILQNIFFICLSGMGIFLYQRGAACGVIMRRADVSCQL
ncbi:hypothetical protein NX87_01055 [Neisseria meningitidis]|nr:hypothetical protein NX87_01055 [Neisseria meningitidis]